MLTSIRLWMSVTATSLSHGLGKDVRRISSL